MELLPGENRVCLQRIPVKENARWNHTIPIFLYSILWKSL